VLDDDGKQLPSGEVGHLAIKAPWPGIMKEVWKNPEKFASYFPFGPEWYVAGDLALIDEDGYVFFQGRSDDMINSSGERIGSFYVDNKRMEQQAVAEVVVIGWPDPLREEIVKEYRVLNTGYQEDASLIDHIRLFVRNRLAAHSAPREIEILSVLPKTII